VRDVFRIASVRFALLLDEDDPEFADWDQDATAEQERYGSQDPAEVTRDLVAAAEVLALQLEAVPADAWGRPGRRSDGSVFTVDTLARYIIHDPVHHLHDVRG
jgi:hypothetical protein